ncbi:hypothetical protein TTHERM_000300029 (macronuclear) [Tetrahymena thermophila SB210]|uniref:Uncharacterized protein n=1 Tax=Tetrahymena thermophila (strain SB210) TaxID=312017 RepID=W7X692_TETTS|nr:hypothetical protein TTHERM_000300029 [Tetrahymena thermophila SB210]EWS71858.1 hypothetical protein TTHERM_000300029 [Tetrahymena thermophila SB210]|eukprot:XP_012655602.1 hypothetical protein TTHERM_000300029 [Tetrahymena thermophila SB210]
MEYIFTKLIRKQSMAAPMNSFVMEIALQVTTKITNVQELVDIFLVMVITMKETSTIIKQMEMALCFIQIVRDTLDNLRMIRSGVMDNTTTKMVIFIQECGKMI